MTGRQRWPDRGSFTAETAAALPAVVLLLFVGLTAITAGATRLGCVDAAREAALAASRGAPAATGAMPPGAEAVTTANAIGVTVTVRAPVRALGARVPGFTVSATAVAAWEPGATADRREPVG